MASTDTQDTEKHEVRNTNKKEPRSRNWVFTLNNYTEEEVTLLTQDIINAEYEIQEEKGKEGTIHLQGAIIFQNARTLAQLKKLNSRAHWEIARNTKAAMQYCQKTETATGKRWSSKPKPEPIIKPENLKSWQINLLNKLERKPDGRHIMWVVDEKGGSGKTTFCKHLIMINPGKAIYVAGKASDMKYAIAMSEVKPTIILLDFSRSLENYVSYEGIESIKNGIFFNTKYECKMVVYNTPHVLCFSNFQPDKSKLSEDRWDIMQIGDAEGSLSLASS